MERLKIYFDTSVISAHFDSKKSNRQNITVKWFENEAEDYEGYISGLVLQEIENNSDSSLRDKMIGFIKIKQLDVLEINEDIMALSKLYRNEILTDELNDTIHIATATYYGLNIIASWNFKHIVNFKTISKIHEINLKNNYPLIEILTLENLEGSKYGSL